MGAPDQSQFSRALRAVAGDRPEGTAALAAIVACCLAAPRTLAPLALLVPLAVLLVAILWRRGSRGSAARPGASFAPWSVAIAAVHLAWRAEPALAGVSLVLEATCCVSAAILLGGAAALRVGLTLAVLELTAAGWAVAFRGPRAPLEALSEVPGRLLAPLVLMAVAAFLSERQRQAQGRLEGRVRSLTDGPPTPVADVDAEAQAAHVRPSDAPRRAEQGAPSPAGPRADLARLLELARRSVRARTCLLFERSLDPPCWKIAAAASTAEDFDGLSTAPLSHGLIAWAAKHEVPFRIVEPGPQLKGLPWHSGGSTVSSFLAVPLPSAAWEPRSDAEAVGAWFVLACDSPLARHFDETAEESLLLHAAEIADRMGVARQLGVLGFEREALAGLATATTAVTEAVGVEGVARALLAAARAVTGASAGAVLSLEAGVIAAPSGALSGDGDELPSRPPRIEAAMGLDVLAGHRLEAAEESWAAWCLRHPDVPVRLAAFGADRGMPRIARGDGLDASWSVACFALPAPGGSVGSLAVAWPSRHLPAPAVLEAADVLARAGACALLREHALARLAAGRRVDGLTGLPGRTQLFLRGAVAAAEAQAKGTRLSVARFDLDGSGALQERRGPEAWDAVIEALGRTLVAALPALAEVHRWGSDEFVALLPGAGEEGALVAARRAVAAVAQGVLAGAKVTLCAGVATWREGDATFTDILVRTEVALNAARGRGPGKVAAAGRD